MTKAELEARRLEFIALQLEPVCEGTWTYDLRKELLGKGWDAAVALLQGEVDAWDYCPECGNKEFKNHPNFPKTHRQCSDLRCLQEYHTDINYNGSDSTISKTLKARHEKIHSLTTQLQSAHAKLAVATKDTTRLDWMIENQNKLMIDPSGKYFWRTAIVNGRFNSDREAIDAAMDASEGKGKE